MKNRWEIWRKRLKCIAWWCTYSVQFHPLHVPIMHWSIQQCGKQVADTLRRNFYVDNILKSASTENETTRPANDVKAVCGNGGLNLTKFVGNTERVINSISQQHRAENVKNLTLGQDKLPIERALGVIWCIESDTFSFSIELKEVVKDLVVPDQFCKLIWYQANSITTYQLMENILYLHRVS